MIALVTRLREKSDEKTKTLFKKNNKTMISSRKININCRRDDHYYMAQE